jgi:FdrA protein
MNDTTKIQELFHSRLVVVNVGTRLFADALKKQGAAVVQVDWRPVAGGDKQLQDILALVGGV